MMKSSVTSRKQRFWALLLAVVMVVGLLPMAGAKAASISTTSNTDDASVVGKIINAGEEVTNTDSTASITVTYRDLNNLGSAWHTSTTIAPNTSYTVLSYDAVVTAENTAAPA